MCITSIKLCAKCLTTANIPLPPANPIDVLAFVTLLKKQSSRCLAPVRGGNGEALISLLRPLAGTHQRLPIQTHKHRWPKKLYLHISYDVLSLLCSLAALVTCQERVDVQLASSQKCQDKAYDMNLSSKNTHSAPIGKGPSLR